MRYHMRDVETGEEVVIERPAALAPDFGREMKWRGRRLVRELPRVEHIARVRVRPNTHVVGWSLPPGVPGATAYMDEVTGKVSQDPSGVPMFDNESDLQRTAKLTKGGVTHGRLRQGRKK